MISGLSVTLLKALGASALVCVLLAWSIVVFVRAKTVFSFARLLGAGFLVVVVLAHICEGLHLFSWMRWGEPASVGHYLDFLSAIFGLALLLSGFLGARLAKRPVEVVDRDRAVDGSYPLPEAVRIVSPVSGRWAARMSTTSNAFMEQVRMWRRLCGRG